MRRAVPLLVLSLVLALPSCSSPSTTAPSAPTTATPPAAPEGCDALPPELASYDAITDGVAFSLTLLRDERGAWIPAHPLPMPLHHASMITWTDDAHRLDTAPSGSVVVAATGLGRTAIEHDATRGVWFATYGARVDRVCPR